MLGDYTRDDARNALWLDHDINKEGIRCIGQHLVQHKASDSLPLRDPRSWNPNIWVGQSWEESFRGAGGRKRDKFPFGTAHFLWDLNHRNVELTPSQLAVLAHADGTWFAADCYQANASIWRDLMFSDSAWIDKILTYRLQTSSHQIHREFCEDLEKIGYKSQSRSQKAKLLPDELKSLVGRQSLTIRLSSDGNKYLEKIRSGIQLISTYIGSAPLIGTQVYLIPADVLVRPTFLHVVPGLTAAVAIGSRRTKARVTVSNTTILLGIIKLCWVREVISRR